jgi:hypothetical protein
MQIQSYPHRMCVELGHRVHMLVVAARPCQVHSYPLKSHIILSYQLSGMSPFSQDVFPGVHAGAAKLSCFIFCDLVAGRTIVIIRYISIRSHECVV